MCSRPRAFWMMMVLSSSGISHVSHSATDITLTSSSNGYPSSIMARLLTILAGMRVLPLFGNWLLLVLTVLVCENSELEVLDKLRLLLRRRGRTTSLSLTRSSYTLSSSYSLSPRLPGGGSAGNPRSRSRLTANGPDSSLSMYRGSVGFRSNVSRLLCLLNIVGRAGLTGRLTRGGLGLL